MGWWSATILGGDTPLDMVGCIEGAIGWDDGSADVDDYDGLYPVDGWDDAKRAQVRDLLADPAKLRAAVDCVNKVVWGYDHARSVGMQVLGVLVMAAGAPLPPELRDKMVEAALADEWYCEGDPERVAAIDDLVAKLQAYDGATPAVVDEEGLLGKIAEGLGD